MNGSKLEANRADGRFGERPISALGDYAMIEEPSNAFLFSDLELARRLEGAEALGCARFAEARARISPQSGAACIQVAGAHAVYDGISSPVTQTFGLGMFQPITGEELDEIERFFTDRGAPVLHEVSPLADSSSLTLLNARDYHPFEFTSVMFRPLQGEIRLAATRNEKIRVRPVLPNEYELWAKTSARGWSESAELFGFVMEVGTIMAEREDSISFLAELDDQPIAAGVLCVSGGVALLAGASTIPEGRRQGAQLALLETRLRYAAEHGCDIAMMCAQPGSGSQRNAERHGFRIAYTRIKWRLGRV